MRISGKNDSDAAKNTRLHLVCATALLVLRTSIKTYDVGSCKWLLKKFQTFIWLLVPSTYKLIKRKQLMMFEVINQQISYCTTILGSGWNMYIIWLHYILILQPLFLLNSSPWISQTACNMQHARTTFGTLLTCMLVFLFNLLHCTFSLPNTISTTILPLEL